MEKGVRTNIVTISVLIRAAGKWPKGATEERDVEVKVMVRFPDDLPGCLGILGGSFPGYAQQHKVGGGLG